MRQLKENTLKFRRGNLLKDKLKKKIVKYIRTFVFSVKLINHYLFIFFSNLFTRSKEYQQYIFNIQKHEIWLNFLVSEYF